MDGRGYVECRPVVDDPGMATEPFLSFGAGYIQRAVASLPRQGDRPPWRTSTDYRSDVAMLRTGSVADPALRFRGRADAPLGRTAAEAVSA
jgi:hypothetical protein